MAIKDKAKYMREWRLAHPEEAKKYRDKFIGVHPEANRGYKYQRRYGISLEDRDALFRSQGSCCAICKTDTPGGLGWCTDHDHFREVTTGEIVVRGILCTRCNTMLGYAKDNEMILLSAIEYLKRNRE